MEEIKQGGFVKLKGFKEFIQEQGVVGLAIGFILGAAVGKVVSSFVNDIIMPLLSPILGAKEGITNAVIMIGQVPLKYGNFLSVLLDFIILAAVIYFVVKGVGLDKLDKKKD